MQRAGTLRYMGPPRPGPLLNRPRGDKCSEQGRPSQANRGPKDLGRSPWWPQRPQGGGDHILAYHRRVVGCLHRSHSVGMVLRATLIRSPDRCPPTVVGVSSGNEKREWAKGIGDPKRTLLTEMDGAKTIITVLPLTECLRLPGITDGRLFRKNVRQSLGPNNKVNKALRATVNGERVKDFFYYHNGVTAICNRAQYNSEKGTLSIEGLSVVNGCQSLSTIFSVSERFALLMRRKQEYFFASMRFLIERWRTGSA